jgi:hypothetical protein
MPSTSTAKLLLIVCILFEANFCIARSTAHPIKLADHTPHLYEFVLEKLARKILPKNLSATHETSKPNSLSRTETAADGRIIRSPKTILNVNNIQYMIRVAVGKPDNFFKVILDTGSTNNLLISKKCKTDGCKEHKQWEAMEDLDAGTGNLGMRFLAKENEAEAEATDHIDFGSGSVDIEYMTDTWWLSGLKVENQTFGAVVNEEGVFEDSAFDGLLGIAYPGLSTGNPASKPIFDTVIAQKLLKKNVFSLYISRSSKDSSRFWLGGVNEKYILNYPNHQINYHNVVIKSWWTLKLDQILVNGQDTGLCSLTPLLKSQKCAIIIDSGTSNMAAPTEVLPKFKSIVENIGNGKPISDWPTITFVIDGKHYDIEGNEYVTVDGEVTYQTTSEKGQEVAISWSPFEGGEEDWNIWIAGDIFMSKFITVFDRDRDLVGIAVPDLAAIESIQSEEAHITYEKMLLAR